MPCATPSRRMPRSFGRDERGQAFSAPLGIVFTIVGAILAFIVIAAMVSPFFGATEDVTDNFTNANVTTGDAQGDNLKTSLGPVIPIIAVVVLFGMIIAAVTLRND